MDLQGYLARIGFSGAPRVDYTTLAAIHHQHLLSIPYENIDVQLGVPLDFDRSRIYNKIVNQKRGGWCYEMNGLLGWALEAAGFQVTRMSGAVMRETLGDDQRGNHLVLEVMLDGQPYLADVGLGDGLRKPVPIVAGSYSQGGLEYRLEQLNDGFWRFHNHPFSNVKSFDFRHEPASEQELADKCQWLQTNPESPFRMLLIAQRFDREGVHVQLGQVHSYLSPAGRASDPPDTLEALHRRLNDTFGLNADLTPVWPHIQATHQKFFGDQQDKRQDG